MVDTGVRQPARHGHQQQAEEQGKVLSGAIHGPTFHAWDGGGKVWMAVGDHNLFCFGLGFSAQALIRHLHGRGWTISGTSRDGEGDLIPFSRRQPLTDPGGILADVTHVLLSIPPDDDGDPVLACHGADLAALPNLRWLGYLSTTGVYGDRGGGWVDEETPPAPTHRRGERRLAAERAWLDWADENKTDHGPAVHIFRLAGIYGPGRNALEAVRQGRARRIVKPGHVFSRIHVDDLAAVLAASMAQPNGGAIYNVCDDEAAPPQDVIAHAASLLGLDPPPEIAFARAELSPMAASFYRDNKRTRNDRIKGELGVQLRYPDYRAGLGALMRG